MMMSWNEADKLAFFMINVNVFVQWMSNYFKNLETLSPCFK